MNDSSEKALELIESIQSKLTPDLLKAEFRVENAHPHSGHCYVATEVLYHMWGKHAGAKPTRMKINGVTHWWLTHPELGTFDATAGQFPFAVQYGEGVNAGFLTKNPSRRAVILMDRMSKS